MTQSATPDTANLATPSKAIVDQEEGRRILSRAFVRIGPDGHLSVRQRDGRELVLRDVRMLPTRYCGRLALGSLAGKTYCGRYADVAAAHPGDGPTTGIGDPSADPLLLDRKATPRTE